MKVPGSENASWGFTVPDTGDYNIVFLDEAGTAKNESTGKESFRLPIAIEGGAFDGVKQTIFIPLSSDNPDFSRRKLGDILHCTGLAAEFEKSVPDTVDILSPKVLLKIASKVIGKRATVHGTKSQQTQGKYAGQDQFNIDGIRAYNGKATPVATKPTTTAPATQPAEATEDWS
jgi:hypothetical protein